MSKVWQRIYVEPKNKYGSLPYWAAVSTFVGIVLAVLLFFLTPNYVWDQIYHKAPKKYRVLVPLDANGSEYLAYMQKDVESDGNATYEEKYSNRASQNIRDIVIAAKSEWFFEAKDRVLNGDDIDFYCFPEGWPADNESYQQAFDHAMKASKAAQRDVVALLGNVTSTSTLKYGEFCAKHGLPMILPLATATNLTHSLKVLKVPAVLRLPPANDKQAKTISDFLLKSGVSRTVVVKDISNEAYSRDLVEGFREYYVEKPLSHLGEKGGTQFGQILGVVPVGGLETAPFLYPSFGDQNSTALKTALLVVGMTNSSLETLAQAKLSKSGFQYAILTDGAVDEYLAPRITGIQGVEKLSNLYLSFPTPCVMPDSVKQYLRKGSVLNQQNFEMSHALYVADGAYIILSMLNSGLREHSDDLGNEMITAAITKLKNDAKENEDRKTKSDPDHKTTEPGSASLGVEIPFNVPENREYKIDKFGNNVSAGYFLYRIEVVKIEGKAVLKWQRAEPYTSDVRCSEDEETNLAKRVKKPSVGYRRRS